MLPMTDDYTITPHGWWDRRQGIIANLSFGFARPLICLIRGHRFDPWWDIVADDDWSKKVGEMSICSMCARIADRDC